MLKKVPRGNFEDSQACKRDIKKMISLLKQQHADELVAFEESQGGAAGEGKTVDQRQDEIDAITNVIKAEGLVIKEVFVSCTPTEGWRVVNRGCAWSCVVMRGRLHQRCLTLPY